jgi:hypothetical protein
MTGPSCDGVAGSSDGIVSPAPADPSETGRSLNHTLDSRLLLDDIKQGTLHYSIAHRSENQRAGTLSMPLLENANLRIKFE